MNKRYIILVLCVLFLLFQKRSHMQELSEEELLAEFYKWKIIFFTGPGKNEERVSSITINKGKGAINKVYALSMKELPKLPDEMTKYQRSIIEFRWTGESWEQTKSEIGAADPWGSCIGLDIAAVREGDGTERLYFGTLDGYVYEYEYLEGDKKWNLSSILDNRVSSWRTTQGFALGSRLKNDSKKYVYNNLGEFDWNGTTWIEKSKIVVEGASVYDHMSSISFGNWEENENCMYCLSMGGAQMTEFKWTGNSWQEVSKLNTACSSENNAQVSRPFSFVADLGKGRKLYTVGDFDVGPGGSVKECTKDNLTWKVNDLKVGGVKAFSITYGRISSEDPYSLYVLDLGGVNGTDSSKPDTLQEYTVINKKWKITWNTKLTGQNLEITKRLSAYNIVDLCMADGRNDEYNRLYIVDSLGNVWECSIPPRKLRPLVDENGNILYDEFGKPIFSGKKGGGGGEQTKDLPSIMGR